MPNIERSALVAFSAEQMYRLVNDVEQYPEFISGLSAAKIIASSSDHMIAKLEVSKSGFSSSFTTENSLVPNRQIKMNLKDGPFDFLTGVWQFSPLDDNACRIEFSLDFKFKSRLTGMAFGQAFKSLAESMMHAFIDRAKKQYGQP